ncbi:F-actin-monooxygenase MICAL2 isoform X2 [Eumetopias jubatus]|uniref:F-actin-monooxygenase MICAL2 isoform X2 n=1 Tax=Eumetopias jubatus TaxID=34886 RepID=UPI001015E73F|nr:F-actin-monooxygenase MICAL2 isoform X2 [Eumetopias jubatus]
MGENEDEKQSQAGQVFENFVQASTCKGTLQAFNILTRHLDLDPLDHRNFYSKLKSKVTTWKAKALWYKLDKRGSHKEYKRGKSCMNTKCLIIGGGPCGLRTAIELAYLGAKVVVVEKRDTFSRNNVLHLWPFTIHDLRGLGAKKFYGKFCAGSIDHISIRQLQLILFKVALMLGVEIHVNVEFVKVLEPPEDQENQKIGWRAEFLPADHSLSDFEFDVIIGADGRRNTLEGFRRKEFRGKLAIAITANFINRNSTAEAKVEEISGVAFIFNQKFFQDLKEETGIDLENIVYYKDCTHYFVMTAKKQSLLDKGVIINDYIDTEMLLCAENVNQDNLLSYAREAADFATNYQLPSLDFALNHYGQPDVAMFDFTSMYASENAALVRERQSHQLLVALVGDSLLEPFWPMGTGCARGFLAAFDTAWMVKSWDQGTPPLELLAERESLYRLLPQTTPENINKNFEQYTLDPGTRYPNLNSNCVRPHQVKHLYVTKELHQCPLERLGSVRRSMSLSRRELDIRPSKLLTWCQQQTEGYQHVNVTNLTTSWRSGLALCAIIHRFRPELINFDSLNEDDAVENNQLAFDVAEREFGIPPVTTGKEMASAQEPDRLSMVMYLSKFYELFRGTPLRPVDSWGKNYGENADLSLAKSSISHNYLNLTFPRKRTPRVDTQTEDSDMNKRRRKGFNNLDEPSAYPSRSLRCSPEGGSGREGGGQNKVKSMASQLLAKFEESSRNPSLLRQAKKSPSGFHFHPSHLRTVRPQESMRKVFPLSLGGSDTCHFCKKRVYVMERLSAEGHFFHRECFRCSICATTLRLAAYAFDSDEGKFFCKPHFIHCKTNSQQRKRRAELKQQREEEGPWKEPEAPRRDTPVESSCAVAAIGTPEGSPPADEPTSPKKPKSVLEPEPSDMEGEATSLLPSEWTSVRISPGENVVGEDMMAVRVLVTSDDSSSDAEPDSPSSEAFGARPCEERPRRPERPPLPEPLTRHSSLREAPTRKVSSQCPEESQAVHALQRASSFQSPPPSKYQSWRRKFQSSLTPVNNKRTMSPSKEAAPLSSSSLSSPLSSTPSFSSASVPGNALDGFSLPQVTANNLPSQVLRGHSSPSTPIFLRRARAQGLPKDMPLYLPHGQMLEQAEYCMVRPGGDGLARPQPPSLAEMASDGCQEAEALLGDTRSIRRGPHPTGGKDRCLPDQELSPRAGEDPGEKNTGPRRGEEDGSELEEGKKLGLKKLVLIPEQKTKLLDWNHPIPESMSLEAGAQCAQRSTDNGRGGCVLKPVSPLLFPRTARETPPTQGRAREKTGTPAERAPPKSPLRLIANAIRRSLEPLLPNSEGGRKASAKPESKTLPTSQPHACTHSFSLRKTSSSKDGNQQSPGKDMASRASAFFTWGSPPARAAQPSYPRPPDLALRTHSLPNQPSKVFPALMTPPCHKMEDVPTLLEKVSLQETSPDASRDPKGKISLFTSFRLKDKSFESSLQESKQRKDFQDLFSTLRGAGEPADSAQPLEKLAQPFSSTCLGQRVHPASPDKDASPKHIPIRVQVPGAASSTSSTSPSSADEDFHPQPSLRSKERKTLRRRRKLEKATKQLVKQEELKRLHKAQAIQRQLEEVEERQRASEIRGMRLEKALRGEAADSGTQDEAQLLQEWFKLALEKNKLMRYESELLIMAQELELEDHQSRLEQKLRQKMLKEESQKDENDLNEEREIFSEMMQAIEQRDRLVDSLEEQRIKEKAEDQHFESFIFSRDCQLSRT